MSKQIIVSENIVDDIIKTLLDRFVQGHTGTSKKLKELRERFDAPNFAPKVQS